MTAFANERPPASRRARIAAIAAVFLCALGVRLLYATAALADAYGHEQERYRIAHFYHEVAASLAAGDDRMLFPTGLSSEETLLVGYPPGYFAFMGAIYACTENSMGAVLLVQCIVDALSCVLLLLLGERLFSTNVGLVAGLLMALSPQFASLSLVLKPDTITVAPVLAAMLLVVTAIDRPMVWKWIAAGLALGVACWLRQNALLLAPVLAAAALLAGEWRTRWKGAALMVAAAVLVVAPIAIRNLAIYGRPIPVTIGSGFALLSGLARDDYAGKFDLSRFAYNVSIEEATARGLEPDAYFVAYDGLQARHERKLETKHTVLSVFTIDGIERDRARSARALELIRQHPGYFATIYWVRVGRLLGYTQQNRPVPLEVGQAERLHETPEFYTALDPSAGLWRYYADRGRVYDVLRPPLAAVQRLFVTPLLLFGAAAGLALALRRNWRKALFLVAPALYYVGLQSLMWAEFRHTLPAHVAVFLFVALAAVTAIDALLRLAARRRLA